MSQLSRSIKLLLNYVYNIRTFLSFRINSGVLNPSQTRCSQYSWYKSGRKYTSFLLYIPKKDIYWRKIWKFRWPFKRTIINYALILKGFIDKLVQCNIKMRRTPFIYSCKEYTRFR